MIPYRRLGWLVGGDSPVVGRGCASLHRNGLVPIQVSEKGALSEFSNDIRWNSHSYTAVGISIGELVKRCEPRCCRVHNGHITRDGAAIVAVRIARDELEQRYFWIHKRWFGIYDSISVRSVICGNHIRSNESIIDVDCERDTGGYRQSCKNDQGFHGYYFRLLDKSCKAQLFDPRDL